jgi:hypothetical protein
MRLGELAYICRIYGDLTQYDVTYLAFLDKTTGGLDFSKPSHMKALLKWLNSWGCRQFAIAYHDLASESILGWARQWDPRLPDRLVPLDRLSDEDIHRAGEAYADLSGRLASRYTREGKTYDKHVGPTGAAKIMFAARPRAFPPWDDPIRQKRRYDGSQRSYCKYLVEVREQVQQLCTEGAELGISAEDIPCRVGRPRSTLPKLIDEYNWVTLTKGIAPPKPHEVAEWYRRCSQP